MNTPSVPPKAFQVGERYENRKGPFEVIALDGDSLRIRWDTGEEADTSVEFQLKVLQNMERELAPAASNLPSSLSRPRWFGEYFSGLTDMDFSADVTGTHWRSRERLGGAVTKLLDVTEPWNSWSIYKRAQVHWAAVGHYGVAVHPLYQTKYLAQLGPSELLYGLYFERSNSMTDPQHDWAAFLTWLGDPDHGRWFHQSVLSLKATIRDPFATREFSPFLGSLVATDQDFAYIEAGKFTSVSIAGLPAFLREIPGDRWLNLLACRTMDRAEVIAQGQGIAATIAHFFNALLPAYYASRVGGRTL